LLFTFFATGANINAMENFSVVPLQETPNLYFNIKQSLKTKIKSLEIDNINLKTYFSN